MGTDQRDVPGTNAQSVIPIVLGTSVMAIAQFTGYELGAIRKLSMVTHLWIDAVAGIILAASPWLFGFARKAHLPHLIPGIAEVGAALFTATTPPAYPDKKNPIR